LSPYPLCACARLWLIGVIVFGVMRVGATDSWGKILRYVDANGVIWFTNIPTPPGEPEAQQITTGSRRPDRVMRVKAHPYWAAVEQLARRHALNPHLVSALMAVESAFDPEAVSPKGAQGLMQLMPLIAQYYRVYNPLNPEENIEGGIRYLSDLLRLFDNQIPLALAAYNGGETLVRKHGGVPPFLEAYVNKVLALYEQARGTSIHRYTLPSGALLFSNVPLSQGQVNQWEVKK
jgi:Transglycosylase SLT domain